MNDLRIVLLGKTGDGKSSTGNTILGVESFHVENSPDSVTQICESKTEFINGRKITVVDGPGFFDTSLPEEKLNGEIVRCITECAPGPHAFLIVLKDGRYTEQEKEVVKKITASFGEEALRYAVVLFTHGNDLSENQTIQDFVRNNTELQELVDKCGGRVHVIDNKHWKQQQDGYRSNRVQVEDLLNTIEEMIMVNGGQCYTNEMLQMVQRAIEEEKIRNERSETGRTPTQRVFKKLLRLVGLGTGILVGAFVGAASSVFIVMSFLKEKKILSVEMPVISKVAQANGKLAALTGAAGVAKSLKKQAAFNAAVYFVAAPAVVGGVAGGIIGYNAAEGAETVTEAMKLAASATLDRAKDVEEKIFFFYK